MKAAKSMSAPSIRLRAVGSAFVTAALCAGVSPVFAQDVPAQTLHQVGTTPLFAQSMDWFDPTHFAVGRWDGSLSFFRVPVGNGYNPVITESVALPSGAGVEMLTAVDASTLVTSDGRDSLAVWRRPAGAPGDAGQGFGLAAELSYDPAYGPANSGLAFDFASKRFLATGHEDGHVLLWLEDTNGQFKLVKAIDVHSPNPPANPWGIRNIRGLALWRGTTIVTGSEDGDLVGLNIPDGKEVFRVRYNASAQRGINAISVTEDWLLVANCSVGSSDKNLWLFTLASGSPVLSDAENLAIDTFRSQTFDFDADLISGRKEALFVSSTEAGLIWMGRIDRGQLIVTGVAKSSPEGGSVMRVSPKGDLLAAATYALRIYKLP